MRVTILLGWSALGCLLVAACSGPSSGNQSRGYAANEPGAPAPGQSGKQDPQALKDGGVDGGPDFRDPKAGDGACVAPNTVCNGACVSLLVDENNCGQCGRVCQGGSGAACIGGACTCTAIGMMYCDDGQGTGCRDVRTDVNNCGACGSVCDPNQFDRCENGQCLEPE
jgi:hypothetical protein